MTIDRIQDENDFEYHKRLVYGKLVDKTLADYDYSELAEKLYGREYASDVARRMMYGSRKTLDLVGESAMSCLSESDVIQEIERKKIELQKERQRFFDQRREYSKLVSQDGRRDHLFESLEKAAGALNETVGNLYSGHDDEFMNMNENEAVLVFSDWHYGMEASNVFNTYNTDICVERVKHIVSQAIDRIRLHKCTKLHIVVLGDMFHGAIHTSARVASEELVCDQIMNVSEILAQSIIELSRWVESVCVYMTYGNHARTVQNKNESIHGDNIEKLIPWWLEQRLAVVNNVEVCTSEQNIDNEYMMINASGHWICATHGDIDSMRTSTRLLPTMFSKKYGRDIEYIILGDKHHRESFEELGVTAMICGSLCGADNFANDKRLYSLPSQMLLIVDKECGVDAEYRINC